MEKHLIYKTALQFLSLITSWNAVYLDQASFLPFCPQVWFVLWELSES